MSKRRQEKQLTKDNYDEGSGSEDDNPTGGFQFASEEQLKGRQIVKARSTRKKDKKEASPTLPTTAAPALSFDFSSSNLDSFTPFAAPGTATNGDNNKSSDSLEKRLSALEAEVTALRQRVAKLEGKPEESPATDAASAKFEFSFPSELNASTPASATGSLSWEQFANTESSTTSSDFSKLAGSGETPAWSDNSNYVVPDLEEKAPKPAVVLAPAEPVKTGEEDEENVVTCRVKLYTLTPKETPEGEEGKQEEKPAEGSEQKSEAQMEWKETGVGNLKLNKLANGRARLIMRTDTTFRLILNTLIFPEMSVKKPTEKSMLLVALDEQLKPKSHMVKFQNAQQTTELFEKIEQFKKEAPKSEKQE